MVGGPREGRGRRPDGSSAVSGEQEGRSQHPWAEGRGRLRVQIR